MRSRPLYDALIARLTRIPGVVDVAATSLAPFSSGSSSTSYTVEGRPVATSAPPNVVQRRMTTPEFFRTMGVPIVEGRAYTAADRAGTTPVLVVSRTLARAQWPGESAIGKRIDVNGELHTIIGVAADIETERPSADLPETFYAPLSQMMPRGTPRLLLRTRAGAEEAEIAATMAAMREAIKDVDAGVTILRIDTMSAGGSGDVWCGGDVGAAADAGDGDPSGSRGDRCLDRAFDCRWRGCWRRSGWCSRCGTGSRWNASLVALFVRRAND
jgi:hypothetical protein